MGLRNNATMFERTATPTNPWDDKSASVLYPNSSPGQGRVMSICSRASRKDLGRDMRSDLTRLG